MSRYGHQPENAGSFPSWDPKNWRTTEHAAETLGVSRDRVRKMIRAWMAAGQPSSIEPGQLPAHEHSCMWVIHRGAVEIAKSQQRPSGRPRREDRSK